MAMLIHQNAEFNQIRICDNVDWAPHRANHDRSVCQEVQILDCYRVKELVDEGFVPKSIVDIGAHIGSFSMFAHKYWPSAQLFSFEPVQELCSLLKINSPRGHNFNMAILGFYGYEEGHNLHKSNEYEQAFRDRKLTHAYSCSTMFEICNLDRLDFLKIDCEQSEVNIFRELDFLDRLKDINVISGEWHFDVSKAEIKSIVGKTHAVEIKEEGDWNHFFARRK